MTPVAASSDTSAPASPPLAAALDAISDAGMRELAAAVARGGLPKCTHLRTHLGLGVNPGSDARAGGARAALEILTRCRHDHDVCWATSTVCMAVSGSRRCLWARVIR